MSLVSGEEEMGKVLIKNGQTVREQEESQKPQVRYCLQ